MNVGTPLEMARDLLLPPVDEVARNGAFGIYFGQRSFLDAPLQIQVHQRSACVSRQPSPEGCQHVRETGQGVLFSSNCPEQLKNKLKCCEVVPVTSAYFLSHT
jgi:hypothetical protein